MNLNKARDLFSDYHEGQLDAAVKSQFEKARKSDPEIDREYRMFAAAMQMLPTLKQEEVEIPHGLHDRIAARIDHHVWEKAQKTRTGFLGSWKLALYGGLACLAIGFGILSLRPSGSGTSSEAGLLVSPTHRTLKADFSFTDGAVHLTAPAQGKGTVTVRDAASNEVVQTISVQDMQKVDSPVENPNDKPEVVKIEFSTGQDPLYIVLPGKAQEPMLAGVGSLTDCAVALASTYHMPVRLEGKPSDARVQWNLSQSDTPTTVTQALSKTDVKAEVLASGIFELSNH